MDSDERGSGKSEEESDEKREQLITIHEESDEREEVRGWEKEVYGATQWEERELQAHMDLWIRQKECVGFVEYILLTAAATMFVFLVMTHILHEFSS